MIGKKINQLATELAPVSTDLTIIGDPDSGVSKKITLAQLGAIFSGAVSFYTNLAAFPVTGDINVIYCAKDTQKLYLWSGSAYVEVFPSQALLDTYQLRSEKGVSNGYASLDSAGKVPISQLPSSIMEYKGTWNASTNTPTLANGTGDTGDVYICNVAGTVNFGAGPITFAVGDYVIYSGTIWQRSSGAVGTVTSVALTVGGDAISVSGSPLTTSGTLALAFSGTSAQYINGAGNLTTFPTSLISGSGASGQVTFFNGANSVTGTNNFFWDSTNNRLGIGTTTPQRSIEIYNTTADNHLRLSGNAPSVSMGEAVTGSIYQAKFGLVTTNGQFVSAGVAGDFVIISQTGATIIGTSSTEKMRVNTSGNVSINNTNNTYKLDVTGTGRYTGQLRLESTITDGTNTYTLPSATGTLALTSQIPSVTGYVPYTGATANLDLGTHTLIAAKGTFSSSGSGDTVGITHSSGSGISLNITKGGSGEGLYINKTSGSGNAATIIGTLNATTLVKSGGTSSQFLKADGSVDSTSYGTGSVTSVGLSSATSGVTIGSTPITTSGTITLAIATASGSQQGLLSSTDWTTFNNKQNALTNPVTGTGTTNYLPKFTGASTIGDSVIQEASSLIGIGMTPVSGYKLNVSGLQRNEGANTVLNFGELDANNIYFQALNLAGNASKGFVWFGTSELMRLNASGNLGLGVTPSAWNTVTAFQVGSTSLGAYSNTGYVNSNAFFQSSWKYVNSSFAARYEINSSDAGIHAWFTAPSGTAGNAISFTQAMTLNASGNLSIGNTNDTYKLDVSGTGRFSGNLTISVNQNSLTRLLISNTNSGASAYAETTFQLDATSGGGAVGKFSSAQSYKIISASSAYLYNGASGGQGDIAILNDYGSGAIKMAAGGSSSAHLTIASTGAATFSSSVNIGTAGSEKLNIFGAGSQFINVKNTTTNADMFVGMSSALAAAFIGTGGTDPIVFSTAGTEKARISSGGNVGIGTTSPMTFGGFTNLTIASSTTTNQAALFLVNSNTTIRGSFYTNGNTNVRLGTATSHDLLFDTADVERMRITSGGAVEMTGTIKTASPSSGSAHAWKLGSYAAGGTGTATGVIYIEVNGQIYSIPALLGTP